MTKRFKPSKDTVIALLSALSIFSIGDSIVKKNEIQDTQRALLKANKQYKEYKIKTDKELALRDSILEQYRIHLDENDALILEKDEEISNLKNQLTNQQSTISTYSLRKSAPKVEKEKEDVVKPKPQIEQKPTTVTNNGKAIQMTMTFYGDGAEENGGYAGIDAQGNKLIAGTIASNYYSFGTKFKMPNGQILTVRDRGGKAFNQPNKIDVFVPRLKGESRSQYNKRIAQYGVKTITLYKI